MFCFLQMAKKSAKSAKSARKNISLIDLNRIVRLNIMYCIVLYCIVRLSEVEVHLPIGAHFDFAQCDNWNENL